jgi:diguanylate cyclase (GGDEF)-like protein
MVPVMDTPVAEPRWFEAAFARSQVALVITAPDGALLAANPAARVLFGDGRTIEDGLLQALREAAVEADEAPVRRRIGPHDLQLHRMPHRTPRGDPFDVIEIVDVTAFGRLEQALRDQLERDGLTGLASRESFFRQAATLIGERRRVARPLAVAMIDLDRFKAVNDRAGHAAGDQVLAGVAACCREGLREGDVIGRLGGDEIAILLPGASRADALAVAERIRTALARAGGSAALAGQTVTLSIGLAMREPAEQAVGPALERADRALYAAKAAGGDRIVCDGG